MAYFLLALLFCNKDVIAQSPHTVPSEKVPLYFGEQLYWKGAISIIPHSLYRGSGLASDGSFLLGESNALKRIDFKNGKEQTLIESEKTEEYAFASVVSPNNQQIAFQWFNGDYWDLRIAPSTQNRNILQTRLLVKGSADKSAFPYDWSPDGKWILTRLTENGTNKIALVSVKDGSIKVIKDIGENWCNKISFSPDGKYIVYDANRPGWKSDLVLCRTDGKNDEIIIKDSGYAPTGARPATAFYFSANKTATPIYGIFGRCQCKKQRQLVDQCL